MKLRFSNEAKADLLRIGEYIADTDPSSALRLVRELRARCASLAGAPLAHPVVQRFKHLGIRKRVAGNYLLYYRAEGSDLTIVRTIHGAQYYDRLLDPPPV